MDARNTIKHYPKDKTINQLVEEQVEKTPDNIAIIFGDQKITYRELNEKSNQLARHIRDHHQKKTGYALKADTLIALCLDRSFEMVISILAVLKAGGAYVPVDKNYPQERIDYILKDTEAKLILTQKSSLEMEKHVRPQKLPNNKVLFVDLNEPFYREQEVINLEPVSKSTDLSYVVYTSGTTGKPKGVLQLHANVHRLLSSTDHQFNFNENDVWTLFHSYVFDFSVWELWGALTNGGVLVIPSRDQIKDFNLFYELCFEHKVTILNHTPSAFYQFAEIVNKNSLKKLNLRTIIFGGEALNSHKLKTWWEYQDTHNLNTQLVNMYGITETTVHVTYKVIDPNDTTRSNIGKPIGDLTAYVLDQDKQMVPTDTEGELYVGGAGLARGYLNLPELTKERFINNPFATKDEIEKGYSRLYKTGDLVRWRPDGDLEYIGRNDDQVKIRGFRIELGGIESQLASIEGISQACVVLKERKLNNNLENKYLIGYYVLDKKESKKLSQDLIIDKLNKKLPEYMVPHLVMELDQFPLTINGKLDKRALPDPELTNSDSYVEPENELERQVCEIWKDVLGLEKVGVNDDFFRIGGDSILSIRIIARMQEIGVKVVTKDIYKERTIRGIARMAAKGVIATNEKYKPFSLIDAGDKERITNTHHLDSSDIEDIYPAGYLQNGMIIEYEKSHAYHVITRFQVNVPYDEQGFFEAWNFLVSKHTPLRNRFILDEKYGYLNVQHCSIDLRSKINYLNIPEQGWSDYFSSQNELIIDINTPGLFQIDILHEQENNFTFVLTTHHAIEDGWSIASLISEFVDIYVNKETKQETTPHYAQYIAKEIQSYHAEKYKTFWQEYLADYKIPSNHLIFDPKTKDTQQIVVNKYLSDELNAQIVALSKELNVSPNIIFIAAYLFVLHKLFSTDDLVIGTVVNNRLEEAGGDQVFGLHLNTIPFRNMLKDQFGKSFKAYALSILDNKMLLGDFQLCPYGKVKSDLQLEEDIFQCAFNYVHFHIGEENYLNHIIEDGYPHESTNIPLTLHVYRRENSFCIETKGQPDFIDKSTSGRVLQYVETILNQAVGDPHLEIDKYQLLGKDEFEQVIYRWNTTHQAYPKNKTVCQLFEEQVEKTPHNVAIAFGGQQLSYRELNERSNQLARYIRKIYKQKTNNDLEPNALIALCLDRNLEMVISIIAVLKAGGAYVPIDKNYPQERIDYIIKDTRTSLILTQSSLLNPNNDVDTSKPSLALPGDKVLMVDLSEPLYHEQDTNNLPSIAKSSDLCYVLYTSGTTGMPKGVQLGHRAVVNRLLWMIDRSEIDQSDNYLFKTNYVFDVSVSDIFTHLLAGSKLFITKHILDIEEIENYIQNEAITSVHFLPSQYVLFADTIRKSGVRKIYFSGESLSHNIVQQIRNMDADISFYNYYGPTESGEITLSHNNYDPTAFSIIGKVAPNNKLFVLGQDKQPVPVGVLGELYISGVNLARGYLNLPKLTHERFMENPFSEKEDEVDNDYHSLYKTGDLVRWLPDGNIEYVGRNDGQVKVRGFRIELEEIQNQLSNIDGIAQACVLLRERDRKDKLENKYLVGYYLPEKNKEEQLPDDFILTKLGEKLPEYMIPSVLIQVGHFPLTSNGKLDKKALPVPLFSKTDDYTPPGNDLEKQLVEIWQDILGLNKIGITDDFFSIGGNSILAIQATYRMNKVLDHKVKITDIFRLKTIENFTANSRQNELPSGTDLIYTYKSDHDSQLKDMILIHPGNGGAEVYQRLAEKLSEAFCCIGIDNYNLHHTHKIDSLTTIAEYYLNLYLNRFNATQQPLYILGWSLGGQIALKMAGILENRGWKEVKVVLLDAIIPDIKLNSLKEELDLAQLKLHIKNRILKDYNASYVDTMLSAVEAEHALHYTDLDEYQTLNSTEVLLFKATEKNPAVEGNTLLEKMNQYTISELTKNNIETISNNLKVIDLPCNHTNILTFEDEIMQGVMTKCCF